MDCLHEMLSRVFAVVAAAFGNAAACARWELDRATDRPRRAEAEKRVLGDDKRGKDPRKKNKANNGSRYIPVYHTLSI